jgi:hypothetical protein
MVEEKFLKVGNAEHWAAMLALELQSKLVFILLNFVHLEKKGFIAHKFDRQLIVNFIFGWIVILFYSLFFVKFNGFIKFLIGMWLFIISLRIFVNSFLFFLY